MVEDQGPYQQVCHVEDSRESKDILSVASALGHEMSILVFLSPSESEAFLMTERMCSHLTSQ